MATIAKPSAMSLLLDMRFDGQSLATATGFVARSPKGRALLFTNRHNVTGRDQNSGEVLSKQTGGIPNEVLIKHNKAAHLGAWTSNLETLYLDDESPRWIEHPILGASADCVGLPLTNLAGTELYEYDLEGPRIAAGPGNVVSVVGFPFGLAKGGGLAIWATGFVASEVDLPERSFLIDCRSRKGQSGSAVIAYRSGGAVEMEDGSSVFASGPMWRLLGIYSGRINSESDLGTVWKTSVIKDILLAADGDWKSNYSPGLMNSYGSSVGLSDYKITWGADQFARKSEVED